MPATSESKRVAITRRWHRYRRLTGVVAAVLAAIAGLLLSWPAMVLVAVIGLAGFADASLAIKNQRSRSNPTIAADILFTGVALMVIGVPGPAVGAVVGRSRQNRANQSAQAEADAQNQQSAQTSAANQDTFNRAYSVCLQGRGYKVG